LAIALIAAALAASVGCRPGFLDGSKSVRSGYGREGESNVFLILGVEHVMASAAQDTVKLAKFVDAKVLPALKSASANAATVEAVTGLVSPQAANIERGAYAVLGVLIKAITDAGAAAGAGGVSVSLDAALVQDIKAIIPAVKSSVTASAATAAA
jgi:hypothetical protein